MLRDNPARAKDAINFNYSSYLSSVSGVKEAVEIFNVAQQQEKLDVALQILLIKWQDIVRDTDKVQLDTLCQSFIS